MNNTAQPPLSEFEQEMAKRENMRMDFRNAVSRLTDKSLAHPPQKEDAVFHDWIAVLEKQSFIEDCIAIRLAPDSTTPAQVTKNEEFYTKAWEPFLNTPLGNELLETVKKRKPFFRPLNTVSELPENWNTFTMMAIPCPKTSIPCSLVLIHTIDESELLVRELLEEVATRVALHIHCIRENREESLRVMALRIAHTCSSSIFLAQLRLNNLLEEKSLEKIKDELERMSDDLAQAQKGFERARLLGVAPENLQRTFSLNKLIHEVGEELNTKVPKNARDEKAFPVDTASLENCHATPFEICAVEERIRYALRDFFLCTWIIAGKKKPVEVALKLDTGDNYAACLHIEGGKIELIKDESLLQSETIGETLQDPALFLYANDKFQIERGLGFLTAWHSLQEADATVKASIADDKHLRFEIAFKAKKKRG